MNGMVLTLDIGIQI